MLADEMRLGLVESTARPGGNVTGIAMRVDGMVGKQMQLAAELIPTAERIGVLLNPVSADVPRQMSEALEATSRLKLTPIYADAKAPTEIEQAMQQLHERGAQVTVVLYDALFFQERKRIAEWALVAAMPVVYAARDHVTDGCLISYGISLRANARHMGVYIDKILKGERPADLPIEFPTGLELVINLKTAKALGLTVPPTLIARADEVIE